MIILAIETTGDLCSIAVRDSAGTLVERVFRHRMHLSERLIGDVDAVLRDAGTDLRSLDGLAVGVGPGSFTGVRIGVMTAKTWADVLGKPLVGIGALDAVAEEARSIWTGAAIPLIRARPGAVYAAAYKLAEMPSGPIAEPALMDARQVASLVASNGELPVLLLGDGLDRIGSALREELTARNLQALFGPTEPPRASTLAIIAARRIAARDFDDPLSLVPLYVASPAIDPRAATDRTIVPREPERDF